MKLKPNASISKKEAKMAEKAFDDIEKFQKGYGIVSEVRDVSGAYSLVPLENGTVKAKMLGVSKIVSDNKTSDRFDTRELLSYFTGWVTFPNGNVYSAINVKVYEADTNNGKEYFALPDNVEYKGQPLTPISELKSRHLFEGLNLCTDLIHDSIKWNGTTFVPGKGFTYAVDKKTGNVLCYTGEKIWKNSVLIDGDPAFLYVISDGNSTYQKMSNKPQLTDIMGLSGFGEAEIKESSDFTFEFPEDTDNTVFKYLKQCLHGRTVTVPQESIVNLKNFVTQIENETITLNLLRKLTTITGIKFSVVPTDEICPRLTVKMPKLADERRKKLDMSNDEYQALRNQGVAVPDCDEVLTSINEDSNLTDLQKLVNYYREITK